MKLHLQIPVAQEFRVVLEGFTLDLFRALSPPFPTVNILRFDGSLPGDKVEIELVVGSLKRRWTSLITEREVQATQAWFTDVGQELPAPLNFWRHQHLISQASTGSVIHELIEYRTGSRALDLLLYPAVYWQFSRRAQVYHQFFGKGK